MNSWINLLILTFVPLFIVIDALGTASIVVAFVGDMEQASRRKIMNSAIATATVIGLVFLFFGQFILNVMGISVGSFAIGGGIVLLVLSIKQVMTGQMVDMIATRETAAIVPIGTPLIVGPATITTLLLLVTKFPIYIVLLSFTLNMLLTWGVFLLGERIVRVLGHSALNVISRVFSLLLAAIAVSMVINGLNLLGLPIAAG